MQICRIHVLTHAIKTLHHQYAKGQFYRTHHDYIDYQLERPCGVRMLTFFLYLNDDGLEGGGTNFPDLDITVMPKKGRALLWPSVLNESANEIDERTLHQALPVEAGTKFAANAWMHQGDYKDAHERNCD